MYEKSKENETPYEKEELPFFGRNLSNLPLGDESGFRDVEVDEDIEGPCDPLIEIGDELLQRPDYFQRGWAENSRLFLRKPAHAQLVGYDKKLQEEFGWRLRVVDPFRPAEVQRNGFCWGLAEVVKNRGEMSWEGFTHLLKTSVEGKINSALMQKLTSHLKDADNFFSYVKPRPFDAKNFPQGTPEEVIAAAANLQLIPLELDPYPLTEHGSGGVVDMEWLDGNHQLVNTGVHVDTQGLESAMPFFEDRVATILEKPLRQAHLESPESRQKYYRQQVELKPSLQKFLSDAGVDVPALLKSESYLKTVWYDIQRNRRAVVNLGKTQGIEFFGLESWHADFNDALGGVRSQKTNIISGGPGYSVFMGQKKCAWGNASKLWEKL